LSKDWVKLWALENPTLSDHCSLSNCGFNISYYFTKNKHAIYIIL